MKLHVEDVLNLSTENRMGFDTVSLGLSKHRIFIRNDLHAYLVNTKDPTVIKSVYIEDAKQYSYDYHPIAFYKDKVYELALHSPVRHLYSVDLVIWNPYNLTIEEVVPLESRIFYRPAFAQNGRTLYIQSNRYIFAFDIEDRIMSTVTKLKFSDCDLISATMILQNQSRLYLFGGLYMDSTVCNPYRPLIVGPRAKGGTNLVRFNIDIDECSWSQSKLPLSKPLIGASAIPYSTDSCLVMGRSQMYPSNISCSIYQHDYSKGDFNVVMSDCGMINTCRPAIFDNGISIQLALMDQTGQLLFLSSRKDNTLIKAYILNAVPSGREDCELLNEDEVSHKSHGIHFHLTKKGREMSKNQKIIKERMKNRNANDIGSDDNFSFQTSDMEETAE